MQIYVTFSHYYNKKWGKNAVRGLFSLQAKMNKNKVIENIDSDKT